jgi:hypothetical protein
MLQRRGISSKPSATRESAQLDCWRIKLRTNSKRSCRRLKLVYDATQKAIGSPFQWPPTLSSHRNVERQIHFVGMKLEGRAQSRPLEEDDAEVAQPRALRQRSSSLRPQCSRSSGCRSRSRDCRSCPDRYPREKVPTRPDFAIAYSAAD